MSGLSDLSPAARPTAAWPALAAGWRRLGLLSWIAAVATVTTLSLLPATAPPGDYGFDKLVHAAGYAVLALLAHLGFERRSAARAAALTMIPLGCLIEVAQAFVPLRYGDPWDALANSIGALAGLALGAKARGFADRLARRKAAR